MSRGQGRLVGNGHVTIYEPTDRRPYYRLDYRDPTGRRRQPSAGQSPAAALRRAEEIDAQLSRSHGGDDERTLGSLVDEYRMHADRILHVESAGSGPEVGSTNDYAYPNTDRYTMTAPMDPIMYAQGATVGPIGHGVAPGELDGVVRLETGLRDADNPAAGILEGGYSHSGVFDDGSTAHRNMLAVMTGGEASLYNSAAEEWVQVEENGQIVDHLQYPMEDPSYVPPTLDVP